MNSAVMMDRIAETSPRAKARMAGVFFALTILTGLFAQGFISERLVVSGDAAAIFGLIGCGIKNLGRLFYFAPLPVVGEAHYLSVFNAEQLQALALLFLNVNDQGAAIALVFFGFAALLKGYLVFRSIFLPRALGVLTVLGGLGWLAFLSPPPGYRLFPYIVALGLLGSLSNILWLLVFGVNEQRWREPASAAEASTWR